MFFESSLFTMIAYLCRFVKAVLWIAKSALFKGAFCAFLLYYSFFCPVRNSLA